MTEAAAIPDHRSSRLAPARTLDVSLAVALDVLVVHRDPDAFDMPAYSSWGAVRLERPIFDDARRATASEIVHQLNRDLERPWPDAWDSERLVETLTEVPAQLTPDVRRGLRRAFRSAGFESPYLTRVIRDAVKLLGLYRAAVSPAETA